jgi:uncharacterized protein (DUF2147 family)
MKLFKKSALLLSLAIGLVLFLGSNAYAQKSNSNAVLGVWETEETKAHVRIYKEGDKFFGKIIKLQEPNNPDGTPKLDKENPDKNKKSRPILNLINLTDFTYAGKNTWEDGTIYNPKDGKTYSCVMTLIDENTLQVRGYVGITLLGKTQTWKRVSK